MQSIHNWFVLGYGSVNITVNLTHYNKNSKQFIVLYFNEALSTGNCNGQGSIEQSETIYSILLTHTILDSILYRQSIA